MFYLHWRHFLRLVFLTDQVGIHITPMLCLCSADTSDEHAYPWLLWQCDVQAVWERPRRLVVADDSLCKNPPQGQFSACGAALFAAANGNAVLATKHLIEKLDS